MSTKLENNILLGQTKSRAKTVLAPVSANLYNVASQVLTSFVVGSASYSPNLAALAANAAPSFCSFSVAADCNLTVSFANGTSWLANLNVSLLAPGARLNLWCALNGFVGTTGTGNIQQLSWTVSSLTP